jgi:hypothetical protein
VTALRVRRALAFALALLALGLLAGAAPSRAADPVVFSAIGDVPYGDDEIAELEQHVADHNRYSPSAFLVHLGDILSSSEACQEIRYQTVADVLKGSEVPVFIVPGDNEWVGCSNPSQGWAWWEEHLLGLEESFCGIWPVEAQSTRPENFSFVRNGVLFLGLNYVSGTPSSVVQADVDWVNAQFAAYGASSRAAVLMAQKEAEGSLFDAVKSRGRAFGKPVLYIHGNGHDWLVDPAYFGEPNMLRVQVERGSESHPPVQVTVTSDGQFLFDQDPWPTGTPEIVRPPCGTQPSLSIDDLFVNEGQNAVFTVSLANPSGSAVSVNYSTQDQTARAGEDYQAKSGSLSFSGSTVQRQVTVATLQDTAAEPGESFLVNLANAAGAAIAKAQGAAVILDDDSAPPPSGSPVLREVATGGSVSSSVVSTSGPLGAASGDLYLAAVSFKPNLAVASVSGLGLSWSPVRAQCGARAQTGVALFRAQGTPVAGTVTANLSGTPSAAVITVARYAGAKSGGGVGNVASANTNGVSGGCSNGVDGTAYAFPLSTGAANSLVFVAAGMRSKDHLPGSGYTEIAETYAGDGGSTAGASLAERLLGAAGTTSVAGGFDGTTDWAVVAAEVLAAGTTSSSVTLSVTTSGSGSVTLNPPGGSYSVGTSVTLTAVPASGYAFAGWSGALTGTANPATLVMDANKSVVASFTALPQYTLSVSTTAGGSVTLNPPGGVYPSGTSVTLTAVPASGYAFTGWGGALGGTANPATLVMDANKSVTASFATAGQFTVTVQPTTGGSVTLSPSGGVYAAGTSVTVTAVPASGYRFGSWGGSLSGTQNPTTLLVDSNETISATFIRQFQVSTSATGSGSVVLSPSGGVYDVGTTVTVTAVPANSVASFLGWSGALTGTQNPTTLLVDGNKSVTGNFTTTYALSISIKGKGSVVLDPPGGNYLAGTQVTLTAVPGSGFRFQGWSGALSGSTNPATLLMNANESVKASFRK